MKWIAAITLIVFSSLLLGCASVREPDVKATIKVWRTIDGIVTHTTVDGVTYVTTMDVEGVYE